MTIQLAAVLTLLAAAIIMFAMNKPRMDAVALIMMAALPFTGVVTINDTLIGFSDPNIVLIAALFVIGEGLVRTGVAQQLGDWLSARAGKSDVALIVLLMMVVSGLGATMSSTAVTAIFIPVALRIAQSSGTAPGQLMMPLSIAALISGMMTLIATAPNLVVNSELERNGYEGFHFFAFTPFGVVVLVLAIVYMIFARRWLPTDPGDGPSPTGPSLAEWINKYKLADREFRFRVLPGSPLVGKTLSDLDLRKTSGLNVIVIERGRRFSRSLIRPTAKTELQPDDALLVDFHEPGSDIKTVQSKLGLESLPLAGNYFSDLTQEIGMAEMMVTADSSLVGKTIAGCEFRTRCGLTVIGLRRGREPKAGAIAHETLHVGDTLLVVGRWKNIHRLLLPGQDLVVFNLPVEMHQVLPANGRAPYAIAILLLVIGLMIGGVVANVHAALLGCLLMGLFRCVDMKSAYDSISWKTIVLIVGMLPFSIALQKTGGVELAATGLMSVIGESSTFVLLGSLFLITAMLGMFISNTATAVLMAPVAIRIADDLGYSPYPFAMIVALAASTAFMTPVSSPVNTLVVTPGNYNFGDFVRVGVPLSLIVLVVCVFMVPIWMPLTPTPIPPNR